ncbi:hypothetical protein [Pseudoalteromonas sp. T1lg75]|nr:hypothetical protein [Pseudoalteromonas sp. T1lg75]
MFTKAIKRPVSSLGVESALRLFGKWWPLRDVFLLKSWPNRRMAL